MTDPRETANTGFANDSNEPTTSSTDRDVVASFISAAAKTRMSLVVGGAERAGQTTLVRALLEEAP